MVLPDAPITPAAVRAGVRSLNGKPRPKLNAGMFAAAPPSNGSISAYTPSLSDRIQSGVTNALSSLGMSQYGARQAGNRTTGFLSDFTPVGAATGADDARTAYSQGRYPAALGNALLAGMSALPDFGAVTGKVAHSIIAPLFHGSPHKFEKFALEKIGTGEGAQAYGHGLYFAENPQVAKEYQRNLSGASVRLPSGEVLNQTSMPFATPRDQQKRAAIQLLADHGSVNAAKKAARKRGLSPGVLSELDALNGASPVGSGHLYEVKLDANPEDFLNWDAPLSEQPQAVQRVADEYQYPAQTLRQGDNGFATLPSLGEQLYRRMGQIHGAPDAASQLFKEAGAPGIRYLDQGSRGAGQGTHNYVVFDPSIIDILNRH